MSLITFIYQVERIGAPILGYIIPTFILAIAIALTWMLYKRFSSPK